MKVIPLPSQERLKELFDYNPDTGVFTYKVKTCKKVRVGSLAGYKNGRNISIVIDRIKYKAHRLAWMYMTGDDPEDYIIDHRDRNAYNNRFSNLRKATQKQNARNRTTNACNVLGLKGVKLVNGCKNRYEASITADSKVIYLGAFKTPEEAHQAYCEAADKYHGEFACYG